MSKHITYVHDDFWAWLMECAQKSDHWWLDDWLQDARAEYMANKPCSQCRSKRRYAKQSWDESRNYVLEDHVLCRACGHKLETIDRRPRLREDLERKAKAHRSVLELLDKLRERP